MQYLAKELLDELVQNIVLKIGGSWGDATPEDRQFFRSFAALVAAHEREECIAIAESKRHSPNFMLASMPPQNGTAVDIANLIRARGEK
jgi:hypothetical protein